MSKETYLPQMKTILENAAQEGYKNGIADGLCSAQRIHLWWSVNHQLKEPHSTEKLNEWSQGELEKLRLKLGDRTDIQVFDTHVRCDESHPDQRSTAGQMAEMISMFRITTTIFLDTGEVPAGKGLSALAKLIEEQTNAHEGITRIDLIAQEKLDNRPANTSYWRDRRQAILILHRTAAR